MSKIGQTRIGSDAVERLVRNANIVQDSHECLMSARLTFEIVCGKIWWIVHILHRINPSIICVLLQQTVGDNWKLRVLPCSLRMAGKLLDFKSRLWGEMLEKLPGNGGHWRLVFIFMSAGIYCRFETNSIFLCSKISKLY